MSDKKLAEDTAKKKLSSVKSDESEYCVYIGPTILGVIQEGTIYSEPKSKIVKQLSREIEVYPLIKTLIVSNKALMADRIKVKTPGNILYVNYQKLRKGKK